MKSNTILHLRNMWTSIVAEWDNYEEDEPKFDVKEFEFKIDAVDYAIEAMKCCDRNRARYGLCHDHARATQTSHVVTTIVARLFEGTLSKSELVAAYPKMKWNVGYHEC